MKKQTLLDLIRNNSIRRNTLLDIVRGETKAQLSTDKENAFVWSTVKKKEDIGINEDNLIMKVTEFPTSAKEGQLIVKDGKLYMATNIDE